MSKPETIKIDDVEYVRRDAVSEAALDTLDRIDKKLDRLSIDRAEFDWHKATGVWVHNAETGKLEFVEHEEEKNGQR